MDEKSPPANEEQQPAAPTQTVRPAATGDPLHDTDVNSSLNTLGPPPSYTALDPFRDPTGTSEALVQIDTQTTDIYGEPMATNQGDESDEEIWQLTLEDMKALEEMENAPLQPTPAPTPTGAPSTSSPMSPASPNRLSAGRPSVPQRRDSGNTNPNRQSSPAPDLCIVCGVRPRFKQGFTVFPVCGDACNRGLEAMQGVSDSKDVRRGQMGNPNRSSSTRSSASTGGLFSSLFSNPAPPPLKMCKVCGVRPRCQRGDRIFPTCGLTCASKLAPQGTAQMCDFCQQRPKLAMNGRTYPHCGRTCRDNARAAEVASASASSSASCTTCLNCWKEIANPPKDDFCSPRCKSIIERRAPILLEVPRGHISFRAVEDAFKTSWVHAKQPCPSVKKVYMVILHSSQISRFEEYGSRIAANNHPQRKTIEMKWIGSLRECGLGDSGNTSPCGSPRCLMCIILKASHGKHKLGGGIPTTSLVKAVSTASSTKKRTSHVVMLSNVHTGKSVELERHEIKDHPPHGYDSVRLVGYNHNGRKIDLDETIVFDSDAVRPVYFISYE